MKLQDSNALHHLTGDIILVEGTSKNSNWVRFLQRVKKGHNSKVSHALICIEPGVFAEATSKYTVEPFLFFESRDSISELNWVVIRNKTLENNKDLRHEFKRHLEYHYGKPYLDIAALKDSVKYVLPIQKNKD